MRRTLLAVTTSIALMINFVAPVAAHEQVVSRTFSSAYYTNGVVKSVVAGFTHNACGLSSEIELVVYYDIMNATKIRVQQLKVNYYLKGSPTASVWGGWANYVVNMNGQRIGTWWGDHGREYLYNPATKDADGYSYVGTYAHNGPIVINGRAVSFVKRTNVDNNLCMGGWDYSEFQLRW